MDLETFNRGVYGLMMAAASTIASAFPGNVSPINEPLPNPQIISAINISSEELSTKNSSQIESSFIVEKDPEKLKLVSIPMETENEEPISQEPLGPPVPSPTPVSEKAVLAEKKAVLPKEEKVFKVEEKKEEVVETKKEEEKPTTTQPVPVGSLNADLIFQMINNHRAKLDKPAFEKDDRICKVAQERGPELQNEIFGGGKMHAGFYALNLPYWASENIAGYNTEQQIFNFWLSDYIHRVAVEGDFKYSCGACYGNNCSQIFTNFAPKKV